MTNGPDWNRAASEFVQLVIDERVRQRTEEGWTLEHDDLHSVNDWTALLARYLGRMGDAGEVADVEMYRRRMVQMAAILTAMWESLDRVSRR